MSTLVWPALEPDGSVALAQHDHITRELDWLLDALQETLRSLKAGLEECAALLAAQEPGATLVLSSHRSEALKGFVTRIGTRIIKGDIFIRLPSLPPPKGQQTFRASISQAATASAIPLEQLATTRTLINSCLDVIDATQWTGDSKDANFIVGQLRLLHDNVREAKGSLKGEADDLWTENVLDATAFQPPLPQNAAFQLVIADAAVVLIVRTLEAANLASGTSTPLASASYSGYSLRERLATALGTARPAVHDEIDQTFTFRGQEVRVRDKIRVESQDPSLMAAFAKLSALERSVAVARKALDVVTGKDSDGKD